MKIVKLTVVANATQRNVQGNKNWVAVKKMQGAVILEATTSPKNNLDEWNQIVWLEDAAQCLVLMSLLHKLWTKQP
jgi:hypothetical protein